MPINCINEIDECDKLEINPDINKKYIDTVKQFYGTYYLSNLKAERVEPEPTLVFCR